MKSYFTYIIFLILLCSGTWGYGQGVSSPKGFFEVNYTKGCTGLEVEVTFTDDFPPERARGIRFMENTEYLDNTTHTYSEDGEYFVAMVIENPTGPEFYDSLKIEVRVPEKPQFFVYNCGGQTIQVKVEHQGFYNQFRIQAGDQEKVVAADGSQNEVTAELTLDPSASETPVTVTGEIAGEGFAGNCPTSQKSIQLISAIEAPSFNSLEAQVYEEADSAYVTFSQQPNVYSILEYQPNGTGGFLPVQELTGDQSKPSDFEAFDFVNNFYCFRGKAINRCTGEEIVSDPICTAQLQVEGTNSGNLISFTTGSLNGVERIVLLRDGTEIATLPFQSSGTFPDTLINCSTPYQYAIRLDYEGGFSSLTEGLPVTNEVQRQLPAPASIISNWVEEAVQFSIPEIAGQENVRLLAYSSGGSRLINEADTAVIALPAKGENTCYRFSYVDACGNESELSETVCAIFLQSTFPSAEEIYLNWNDYEGYENGVQRYVLKIYPPGDKTPYLLPLGLSLERDISQQAFSEAGSQYQILAYPAETDNLPFSSSNLFSLPMKGYFPNAFSPNGDGFNDVFRAEGPFVEAVLLQIYNRWGALVYQTTDNGKGWDGTRDNEELPSDTYVYNAVVTTIDGTTHKEQGAVYLIRQ